VTAPSVTSSEKRQILLDCAVMCLLTAALIAPLFRVQYLADWKTTDGAIVTSARYIADHFPHPKWQALWYGGARFDYLNPPAAGFGTALISKLLRVAPAQGYHIFLGAFYCVGVAGVYFLVRIWSGRRVTGWLAAAGYAVLSPVYAIFPNYLDDSALGMPLRLNYLLKWSEGPHLFGLAVLPFAIGFLHLALRHRSRPALLACSLASAITVSASLYAGAALLILSAIAAWAIALDQPDWSIWWRCGIIAALTYGLCAWWLTPSFLAINLANLSLVTAPGNSWSRWIGIAILAAFLLVVWRCAGKFLGHAWPVFLSAAGFVSFVVVAGAKWFGFRIAGDPMHFLPELDLMLVLLGAEAIRRIASIRRRFAIGLVVLTFFVLPDYVLHPWSVYPVEHDLNARVERRLPEWIARNLPGSRVFTGGSVRYWYAAWRDLAEITGGSDQGMPSRLPSLAQWQTNVGDDHDYDIARAIAWMIATGTDAIVTHEDPSQEPHRHLHQPRKFMGRLAVIYDRDGDIVYRVPRRFPGLARVVSEVRMASLAPIPWSNENRDQLRAYAGATEDSAAEVDYLRVSITEMRLRARTAAGESILVQETWDPGWTAYEGSAKLPVVKDVMNFMRIQTRPGDHDVRLVYVFPIESRIGQAVTLLTLFLMSSAICCFAFRRNASRKSSG